MGFKIRNFFGGIAQKIKDHKSDLLMSTGTAGVLGGTVLLCKETLKAPKIIAEYREERADLDEEEAGKKDVLKLKAKTAGKLALNFLPGTLMEGAGLGMQWGGYLNMKAAFIGVGAAYSGLQEFVDKYREGVREKYGEEADEELAYSFRTEEITVTDEDGTQKTETVRIYPRDYRGMPSPYARYFCPGEATGAEPSLTYNLRFLTTQEEVANCHFRAHKKMMLNDLYEMLGIKQSKAGYHVGWIYDKNAPVGDNRIDFRIQAVYREREDGSGFEKVLMIDPNVDGMVEEKMVRMGLIDA